MKTQVLSIVGMTSEACIEKVNAALKQIGGVNDVNVSLFNSNATVDFDQDLTSPQEMQAALQQAGYRADFVKKSGGCCGACGG